MIRLVVIVVTYNRINQLKHALDCYDNQILKPQKIIVVNNGSWDGTKEYLDDWIDDCSMYRKECINLKQNMGGAGGFSVGIENAIKGNCDFVFLSDDDAYPNPDTLKILVDYYEGERNKDQIGAIASAVIDRGEYAKGHRKMVKKTLFSVLEKDIPKSFYYQKSFEIDHFSFVGAMIKTELIYEIGFPRDDFFIYCDDIEYSSRIKKRGYKLICVPQSVMKHDSDPELQKFSWKNYYSSRNKLIYAKEYFLKGQYLHYITVFYLKNCSIVSLLLKKRSRAEIRMFKRAMLDARNMIVGMNKDYKPGVDIERL